MTAVGREGSDDEFGILEDERCIDTGAFQYRYLHEFVFACSDPPRLLRPQISFAILTEADWCALRTDIKCDAALLPVVGTFESGCARDLIGLLVSQKQTGEPLVSRRQASRSITVTRGSENQD